MYLFVDSRSTPCYVYVHEDGLGAWEMLAIATSMWRKVCCALNELLAIASKRKVLDYSPSKPASKIAYMAARATSLLSSSL